MVIPEKLRQRACKPKTRTGCRTCKLRRIKCDEGRPSCHRCLVSKRECGGYADQTVALTKPANYSLILPKPRELLQSVSLSTPISIVSADAMHLDFFRLHTVKELPGSDLGLPWASMILSASSCEPVITRAVAALGSIHRARTYPGPHGGASYVDSYELYQRAVIDLRHYIDRTPELNHELALETTITVILLLFCFEVMGGNDQNTGKHLRAAVNVLSNHRSGNVKLGPQGQLTLVLDAGHTESIKILTLVFLRLSSDWITAGPDEFSNLQAICERPMPDQFDSHRDASIYLEAICSEVWACEESLHEAARNMFDSHLDGKSWGSHECAIECLDMAKAQLCNAEHHVTPIIDVNNSMLALTRWHAAYAHLMEFQPRSKSSLLLEIQFLQVWIILNTQHDSEQTACDRLHDDFERAINAAEEYMVPQATDVGSTGCESRSPRSLPNLGNNLATGICLVIEMCRDSSLRRRAIHLLRGIDLDGVFDTPYLVAYYEHLVDLEEMRARALHGVTNTALKCQDIPREARFLESLMCYCESGISGEEFYKKSHGRLIYVVHDSAGGLEVGESCFEICRVGQS